MRINELFYKERFPADAPDAAFFDVRSTDAIHPNDLGAAVIARRMIGIIREEKLL